MITKEKIKDIIRKSIELWHEDDSYQYEYDNDLEKKIAELARNNYNLWHLEDKARIPDADSELIADVKRKIDKENQNRNDKIEDIDDYFTIDLKQKNISPKENANMNSETTGSIIDRIAILELKIFHMKEETLRSDIDDEHKNICLDRMSILQEQQKDLLICFETIWREIIKGNKIHKTYRQFKMYNDPKFNPEIYLKEKEKVD